MSYVTITKIPISGEFSYPFLGQSCGGSFSLDENALNQAIALLLSGKKIEAREILKKIIQDDPRNESAWIWLARTHPDYSDRIILLEESLKYNPGSRMIQDWLTIFKPGKVGEEILSNKAVYQGTQDEQLLESEEKNPQPVSLPPENDSRRRGKNIRPRIIFASLAGLVIIGGLFFLGIWFLQKRGNPATPINETVLPSPTATITIVPTSTITYTPTSPAALPIVSPDGLPTSEYARQVMPYLQNIIPDVETFSTLLTDARNEPARMADSNWKNEVQRLRDAMSAELLAWQSVQVPEDFQPEYTSYVDMAVSQFAALSNDLQTALDNFDPIALQQSINDLDYVKWYLDETYTIIQTH